MNRHVVLVSLAFLLILGGLPHASFAQSDGFALTGINFNFTNPGARARGIGGAFVAIADDSTAALANPAGLAYLEREFSIEGVHDEEEYPVGQLTNGGVDISFSGTTRVGTALGDPHRERADSSSDRLNYASFLFPLKKNRATLALFYGVLADLQSNFTVGDGLVCFDASGNVRMPAGGESCTFDFINPSQSEPFVRYYGQKVSYSLKTEMMGAAVGYRFGDRWSVGFSAALGQTTMKALAERIDEEEDSLFQETLGDDEDLILGAGILYRADSWGFGLSYRSESDYGLENRAFDGNGQDIVGIEPFAGRLTVPWRASAGLAFFPADSWVISAEVTQIAYSDLLRDMKPFDPRSEALDIRYRTENVTEYHLGVEYTRFQQRRGWSVRAGWWRDQTHLPYVREAYSDPFGDPSGDGQRAVESLVRAPFTDDIDHFTVGFGVSSGVFRLDAAADFTSESGTDYLLSGVFYF